MAGTIMASLPGSATSSMFRGSTQMVAMPGAQSAPSSQWVDVTPQQHQYLPSATQVAPQVSAPAVVQQAPYVGPAPGSGLNQQMVPMFPDSRFAQPSIFDVAPPPGGGGGGGGGEQPSPKKRIIVWGGILLLLAAAGGGYWYVTHKKGHGGAAAPRRRRR